MNGTNQHTQISWAQIMLRAAKRCETDEDQKDFLRFVLNPEETWDVPEPVFKPINSEADVLIQKMQTLTVKDTEEEKQSEVNIKLENTIHTNGGTTYIVAKPIECKS